VQNGTDADLHISLLFLHGKVFSDTRYLGIPPRALLGGPRAGNF
jgi:hypothetical protein